MDEREKSSKYLVALESEKNKAEGAPHVSQSQKDLKSLSDQELDEKVCTQDFYQQYKEIHRANDISGRRQDRVVVNELQAGADPKTEYLKQCHKDKLMPHFLPFKKLTEAENENNKTGDFRYKLDDLHITTRIAPSISKSLQSMQSL